MKDFQDITLPIISKTRFLKVFESLEKMASSKKSPLGQYAKELLVELEELQGITGLKALRVKVNYSYKDSPITYDELMKTM